MLWVGDVHISQHIIPKAIKRDCNHGWEFWMVLLTVLKL